MRRVIVGRRALVLAAVGSAMACASVEPPPGGPVDREPPQIVTVVPESGTVSFRGRDVEFRFDEVINDRGTGAAELRQLVLVSPRQGSPRVSPRRTGIAVRPRGGWRPNTAYTVTLLPGVADLRGNVSTEGRTVALSTGPTIPPFALRGRVYDWVAERPAPRAWVEAIGKADTSVVYVSVADSAGLFSVGPLPEGAYTLRAFVDQNNNRGLDRSELWDTLSVRTSRAGVVTTFELRAANRDTVPPRITGVALADSTTLMVEFDRPLDPAQAISPALFSIQRADSTLVPIRAVLTRRDYERLESEARSRRDSAAADTAGRDVRRAPARRPEVIRAGLDSAPRPAAPPPPQQVAVRVAAPFQRNATYRVSANGVRNLVGRAGTSSRTIQVPAAPDSAGRAPPP